MTDSDFLATMAQITDALQKFPLAKPNRQPYKKSPGNRVSPISTSQSDQQISRRPVSLLKKTSLQQTPVLETVMPTNNTSSTIEASTSMIIGINKNDMFKHFSEKEKNVLQLTKSSSIQNMEGLTTEENRMTTIDLTGGYYDFSSCLQSRIDAQIVELARARSNKTNRSPVSSFTKLYLPDANEISIIHI